MKKQLQTAQTSVVLILFIVLVAGLAAQSRITSSASYRDHVAQNDCRDWGTASLSGEATSTITTKCKVVEACSTGISNNPGATATTNIICNIPDQTAIATKGLVYIRADAVGDTASGTTSVSYGIDGYGTK